jgi:LacI family transcriptional regulator
VARLAGVSPALVSYVINPGSRPVSADARRRIEAAIEELEYRPNAIAQALRRSSSHSIGLLVPNLTSPVVSALAEQIERNLQEHGYVLLTGITGSSPEREADYVRRFLARHVDALVLISTVSMESLSVAATRGVPVLALDRVPAHLGVSSLLVDAEAGAAAAVNHLAEVHGHTRIACLAPQWPVDGHGEQRVTGWRDALRAAGLPHGDDLLIRTETFDRRGGRDGVLRVLDETGATAVFVAADLLAIGALDGLRSRGVPVPSGLAVVSYDGTVLSETTWPRLTTVDQGFPEVATKVTERLMAKVGKNGEGPTHDMLPTALIVRESCGCSPE